jgi:glucokinase
MGTYVIGVDIGGTTVKIGIFSAAGERLHTWQIPTRLQEEGSYILPDTAQSIREVCKEKGIAFSDVLGVGIGVPAPVTSEGIVHQTANLRWGYKDVNGEMSALLSLPVAVTNDANAAALGEMWKGAGSKDMILVTLGTGVGGGLIVDGKLLIGAHGSGGEIGHLCVEPQEVETCGCGKHGCIEQYASATGIVRLARKKMQHETRSTLLAGKEALTAKDVFDAVKEQDVVAIEIAQQFGQYLGFALANLAVVVDPSVIVIGGGVSKAGEVLLSFIEEPYQKAAFFANHDVTFRLAQLGNDAGMYGVAKLVLDTIQ